MFETEADKSKGIYISSVMVGSVAEEVGLEEGDILLSINDKKPADIVDYRLLTAEEEIELEILKRDEEPWVIEIEKDFQEPLGLSFSPHTIDPVKTCANNCVFCFISQNPPGMRQTVYFRDDDYRLSFLEGNYITLNNLTARNMKRIVKDKISPLYVSIHATRSRLRQKMMRNPEAGKIMRKLRFLTRKGIHLHGQIVVCPGWNDGAELERSLNDLAFLGKAMKSVAVVPVGLTAHRDNLTPLNPVSKGEAEETVQTVHRFQERMLRKRGSRFAFLADEFYLAAGVPVPPEESYEDFPQLSNGVGIIRLFKEEYREWSGNSKLKAPASPLKLTVVTGESTGELLAPVVHDINKISNLQANLEVVPNTFYGPAVTVSGLLAGFDLLEALQGKDLGDALIVPGVMLKEGESVFLDGRTPEEVAAILGVKLIPVFNLSELSSNIDSLGEKGESEQCQSPL